jgi:hypothetical protein
MPCKLCMSSFGCTRVRAIPCALLFHLSSGLSLVLHSASASQGNDKARFELKASLRQLDMCLPDCFPVFTFLVEV